MLVVHLRALALQPRIRLQGRQLSVGTPWIVRLLTLGAYQRLVHVDGEARYVYLLVRRFWFLVRSRIVPFKDISRIRYAFDDVPTSIDIRGACARLA
jgi:hypothetical protein